MRTGTGDAIFDDKVVKAIMGLFIDMLWPVGDLLTVRGFCVDMVVGNRHLNILLFQSWISLFSPETVFKNSGLKEETNTYR
jgi:hypothetical protein